MDWNKNIFDENAVRSPKKKGTKHKKNNPFTNYITKRLNSIDIVSNSLLAGSPLPIPARFANSKNNPKIYKCVAPELDDNVRDITNYSDLANKCPHSFSPRIELEGKLAPLGSDCSVSSESSDSESKDSEEGDVIEEQKNIKSNICGKIILGKERISLTSGASTTNLPSNTSVGISPFCTSSLRDYFAQRTRSPPMTSIQEEEKKDNEEIKLVQIKRQKIIMNVEDEKEAFYNTLDSIQHNDYLSTTFAAQDLLTQYSTIFTSLPTYLQGEGVTQIKENITRNIHKFTKSKDHYKKKTLVIGLERILLTISTVEIENYDAQVPIVRDGFMVATLYLKFRPFLFQFLEHISTKYEVIVFAKGKESYISEVVDVLERERRYFAHRMHTEFISFTNREFSVKCISVLFKQRKREDIVMIDLHPGYYMYHLLNGVPIKPYDVKNIDDKQLIYLAQFLDQLSQNLISIKRKILSILLIKFPKMDIIQLIAVAEEKITP